MQAYGSLAFHDNSDVGAAVLGKCRSFCDGIRAFLLPVKGADPHLSMGQQWCSDCVVPLVAWALLSSIQSKLAHRCRFFKILRLGLEWSRDTDSCFLSPNSMP